jgi:hypothetical protein
MWLYRTSSPSAPDTEASTSDLRSLSEQFARSCTWNGKSLLSASWLRVFKTAPWLLPTFGATLKPSTGRPIAERRTSSARAIRASRSVVRASSSPTKIRATSGRTSRASSAKASPSKSSSKTWTRIFDSASMKSPENWKAWVTALRADSLARRKSGRLTADCDSSSWPSARAEDSESCGNHPGATDSLTGAARQWPTVMSADCESRGRTGQLMLERAARNWPTPDAALSQDGETPATWLKRRAGQKAKGYNGNGCGTPLAMASKTWNTPHGFQNTDKSGKTAGGGGEFAKQVMAWPTPGSCPSTGKEGAASKKMRGSGGVNLHQAAHQWPTPDAPTTGGVRTRSTSRGKGHQTVLAEQASSWPTPVQGDHRSGVTGKVAKKNARPLCEAVHSFRPAPQTLQHGPGCSCSARMLNPRFVEHLMGVPVGWTDPTRDLASADFEHWATVSSRLLRHLLTARSMLLSAKDSSCETLEMAS